MARFTRQFPPVLDTLMKNILDVLYVYEQQKVDEGETEDESPPKMESESGGSGRDGQEGDPDDDDDPNGGEGGGGGEGDAGDDEQDGDPSQGSGGGVRTTTRPTGKRRLWRT